MNRIHRLVFNPCTGACQAVPEVAASSHAGAPGAEGRPTGLPRRTRLATACLIALGALASTGSWAQDTYGPLTGAPGANGVFQLGTGTSGGAGSAAFEATASGFHYDALTGGQGGAGGPGIARGGNGGSGGAGLISHAANVVLFNAGTMTGGQGGTGGSGITRGAGGAGGTGAALDAPATLLNDSLISGGRGGNPGAIGGGNPAIAEGGVGVTATGGTSIENGGTISGGLSGNGLVRADAIRFTGDYNWLGLLSTSVIQGNVVASPSQNDTLALVGTADGSFDASLIGPAAQYRNFAAFQKLGTSTWTLTGATAALTPWYLNAGTLAIATDASLGDVAGALTLDGGALRTTADITSSRAIVLGASQGTLDIEGGTTYTANTAVTGAGGLTKAGNGILRLTADNTYTGGTTIAAGTLQLGDGGTAGSITGDVANEGTLAFNRSDATSFAGTISAAGRVEQRGSGTTTLTAANTYSGGTAITAGTLQLGDGGTAGSLTGDVINQGTLAFTRSDATTFAGTISGAGRVEQRGTGMTTLTAANTYSGGTAITAGTLAGSAASLGSGAILNNAALVIDQAQDAALGNAISGSGSLTKTGAGALELRGGSAAFAGNTQVASGTLAVSGALGGALTVGSGARLSGTGTVGTTTVQSGATLAPGSDNGNGLGTLNVAGSLTLASGSRYQINALGDGQSDALRVSGAAALQGGNVEVLASGAWNPSTRYSIVTAGGGVSGQFGGVSTNMAFLEPLLSYSPGSVTLRLQRNDVTFQDVAQTPNQRAAAGGVAGLHTGPLYSAVVQLNAADARSAFDALSGEAHASLKSAAIEDSRFVRDAGLARARTAFEPSGAAPEAPAGAQGGVWAQAFDSWGSDDGDANASLTSRSARGLFLGADTRTGNDWRLGVLGGYSRSRLTLDNRASGVTGDTYHVGVYGGRQWGALGVRAGASYSAGKADTRRSIAFTGVNSLSTASYDVSTTQVFGELGWRLPTPNGAIEPFAGLAHVHLRTDAFSETGGLAALSAGKSSSDTTYSTLGVRATRSLDMAGVSGSLRGSVGWRHAYGDVKPSATLAFAGQNGFTTVGAAVAKNAIVLEGGIDFALQRNLTLGVSYVGQAGSNMNDHGIKASLLWKF